MQKELGSLVLMGVIALNGCYPVGNKPQKLQCYTVIHQDEVTVGHLYFYNVNHYLNKPALEEIASGVKANFEHVGIKFRDIKILGDKEFPNLKGLDILIYTREGDAAHSSFGIGLKEEMYDQLQSEIQFPYIPLESVAHTGLVSFEKSIFDDKQIIKLITHEVAHGFGAAHVSSHNLNYFMSSHNSANPCFDNVNVANMKKFIKTVKTNLSTEDLIKLRWSFVWKKIYDSSNLK